MTPTTWSLTSRASPTLREVCQTCSRPWKACDCGAAWGDVLDMEHALSVMAELERVAPQRRDA